METWYTALSLAMLRQYLLLYDHAAQVLTVSKSVHRLMYTMLPVAVCQLVVGPDVPK